MAPVAPAFDLILKNGRVVTPGGIVDTDIAVRDGRIADLGDFSRAPAKEIIDCKNLYVLPGVIDTQVHFREPGLTHKEDLSTGTLSAIMGGVTTVFEMPNTDPLTITAATLHDKLHRAAEKAFCDYAFFIGGCAENAHIIGELEKLPGCCGVKIFMGSSTGALLAAQDEVILKIFQHGSRRVALHAEDEERLKSRKYIAEQSHDVKDHPVWRDVECALKAVQRAVRLARVAGRKIHLLHVTSGDEMVFLKDHKDIATIETTPQHLTLSAPECYERLGRLAQMNPPIRDKKHTEMLWTAVRNGTVDVLGSDHAPHTLEEKAKEYPASPSGMTGVQTMLPVMLDHVNKGNLSLERLIDLLSHGPQRIYQIAGKGRIAAGYDADFALVDLKRRETIANRWIKSRCGWTPFDGMAVTGWVQGTVLRGRPVMWDGELTEAAKSGLGRGKAVRFADSLTSASIPDEAGVIIPKIECC
ncbi:MAG: dihydroorotase [Alphaproteobacteria bacterium]|nr:MAG: dihydroorotase [Alphaproteobacteria bacterium]